MHPVYCYYAVIKSTNNTITRTCSKRRAFFPLDARYRAVELPSTPAPITQTSNTSPLAMLPRCSLYSVYDPLKRPELFQGCIGGLLSRLLTGCGYMYVAGIKLTKLLWNLTIIIKDHFDTDTS